MNVSEYKYPSFWLNIRKDFNKKHEDAKKELKSINEGKYIPRIVQDGEMELEEYVDKLKKRIVKTNKINNKLKCPMNYLCELKLSKQPNGSSTLPMDYFFNKYELETNRRQSKKVEELIEKYSLDLYNDWQSNIGTDLEEESFDDNSLLLREDFDNLIEDIRRIYISKTYIGLMSWLIDRAFIVTSNIKRNKNTITRKTNENKALLLKVLYDINSKNLLQIFSKNIYNSKS